MKLLSDTPFGLITETIARIFNCVVNDHDWISFVFRCFLDLFVDFIPNPACNVQLIDTEYGFEQPELNKAAQNFLNRLRELDENLTVND